MKTIQLITLLITSIIFVSCEKVIDLKLEDEAGKIVIEGDITNNGGPQFVRITKTVKFSDASLYPSVADATVIITDNVGTIDTLQYVSNGVYKTNRIIGVPGNIYNLTVIAQGKVYTAQSTMPQNVAMDSLRYTSITFGGNKQYSMIPVYTDPTFRGNNYRFLQYVNGKLDKGYINFNDDVNNGQVNQRPMITNDIEVKVGDNVSVEMRCVDAVTFTYFVTLEQAAGGGPGGGTTPSNPPNNLSNGALGLFSAYTVQTKAVVVR
jgi:hypothetical protein